MSNQSNITSTQFPSEMKKGDTTAISVRDNKTLLPLSKIEPDGSQIRKEFTENEILALANSIKTNGLITPIIVTQEENNADKHKIIDGERRYRAYQLLSADETTGDYYKTIPVNYFQTDSAISGILANMARKVYNPMESAEALQQIKNSTHFTDEQIGHLVERSRSSVTEYLSLLKLPEEIRERAKQNSCVPFRALKRLATMESTKDEIIKTYNKLYEKYRPKEAEDKRKSDREYVWSADRIAGAFSKRIDNLIEKMEKLKIGQMKDNQKKDDLKKALDLLTKKIRELTRALEN